MSILSLSYLAFLFVLVNVFYLSPKRIRPFFLLLGNLLFYLSFDLRYSLFFGVSIVSVYGGTRLLGNCTRKNTKRFLMLLLLLLNVGTLLYVKFAPYTVSLVQKLFPNFLGGSLPSVLVPIGISFYTLQLLGYAIDVYKGKYPPEKNVLRFALFASFFPLILQGPIARYDQLAPQLYACDGNGGFYENLTAGAPQILWGFFKKLVIADRAAILVNAVFAKHWAYSAETVVLAILLYTIQIYADFSGCVDICCGSAKLFGISVPGNFRQPYFATSIQDFWKRWHISLSSWLRDYVYIPLGGNRKGKVRKYVNLLLVFLVSGIWHGVGGHYIVWGLLQGVYQIIGALTLPIKKKLCQHLSVSRESAPFLWLQRLITFGLVNISWVFFRAESTRSALSILKHALLGPLGPLTVPELSGADLFLLALSVGLFFAVSYYQAKGISPRKSLEKLPLPLRFAIYLGAIAVVGIFGIYGPGYSESSFIYMTF